MVFNPTENRALELKFRANTFENGLPVLGVFSSTMSLIHDMGCVFYYAIGCLARCAVMDWDHSARCLDCCCYSLQSLAYSIVDILSLGFYGFYRNYLHEDGKVDLLAYKLLRVKNGHVVTDRFDVYSDEYKGALVKLGWNDALIEPKVFNPEAFYPDEYKGALIKLGWNDALIEPKVFNPEAFDQMANRYIEQFKLKHNPELDYGYVEKKVVTNATQVFVRADLHGDLVSLEANLKMLYYQGLIDWSGKCQGDVHLVFLGDYVDRGQFSMQVLERLMTLKMDNPEKVTLIRGNHEYVEYNQRYSNESIFDSYVNNKSDLLKSIYQTMPLALYLGQKNTSEKIQYALFSHGAFDLEFNSGSFLDGEATNIHVRGRDGVYNYFNVADIGVTTRDQGVVVTEQEVKENFRKFKTGKSVIKVLFRGHQHLFQKHYYQGKLMKQKLIAVTLSVGMEVYQSVFKQPDTSYILKTDPTVRQWTHRVVSRFAGSQETAISEAAVLA